MSFQDSDVVPLAHLPEMRARVVRAPSDSDGSCSVSDQSSPAAAERGRDRVRGQGRGRGAGRGRVRHHAEVLLSEEEDDYEVPSSRRRVV